MRPLLKWLTKDRRRRFVRDDGETYVVDNGVPDSIAVDTSAGMAIIKPEAVVNSASLMPPANSSVRPMASLWAMSLNR